ncbi:MAG: metal-dependent hydrolase [Proteobacteria bacterium ST_bin13]|nr:MAG: metal-dependent hydrolase [Proteobacteria bacterium ST_bin13]
MSGEIDVVRHPRARRARLSVDPATGKVRLTIPKRAALAPALRWAEDHGEWIAEQRAKLPVPRPFVPGATLPIGDALVTICWDGAAPRRIVRIDDALHCGGPIEGLPRRIATWLRREALALLSRETEEFAARLGVSVSRVAIGDPRGRWGSCASSGAIRYSWRLILMPDRVRRATVAHEVAHRVEMNHSPAFHALVDRLVGEDAATARIWLRRHGAALHWLGRDS